jgi:pimeloyl-ACP methyl ester carboxylesterase
MMMNPDRSEARLNRIAGDLYGGPFRTDKDLAARLRIAHKVISKDYKRQHGALMLDMAENANPFFRAPVHKQPTVILAGEDDPLTHPDNSVELHLRLPGSVLHIIENGGHMFPITMPRETVDLIETTLADPIPLA